MSAVLIAAGMASLGLGTEARLERPTAALLAQMVATAPAPCSDDGVTVRDGKAVRARHYDALAGFAATAGTTGGLGRSIFMVDRADDPLSGGNGQGTLRHAVSQANAAGGGWIAFAPALRGRSIALAAPLRLGSNISVDGGCSAPLIAAAGHGSILYLRGSRNIVITRLAMEHVTPGQDGDCITVSHGADRIWLGFLNLRACRDGLVDVTRDGASGPMRITLSHSRLRDHDKALLVVGTPVGASCALSDQPIRLTIFRNLFLNTGQRHPRASGDAFVDLEQNAIAYAPQDRWQGHIGGSYGTLAAEGARILIDSTLYLPPESHRNLRVAVNNVTGSKAVKPACRAGVIEWRQSAVSASYSTHTPTFARPRPSLATLRPYALPSFPVAGTQGLLERLVPLTGPTGWMTAP